MQRSPEIATFVTLPIFTLAIVITRKSVLTAANQPCTGNGGCSGTCAVIDGLEQCFCPTGFVLNELDQQTCIGKMMKRSTKNYDTSFVL